MIKPASILLVEDNPMDVELIIDAFKEARLNNKIQTVENGKKAIEFLFGEGIYRDRNRILSCWTSRCRALTAMRS